MVNYNNIYISKKRYIYFKFMILNIKYFIYIENLIYFIIIIYLLID